MTNMTHSTTTDSARGTTNVTAQVTAQVGIPVREVVAVASDLANAGRWGRATALLEATTATDAPARALIALAGAQVAVESDWFAGTNAAGERLADAQAACDAAGPDLEPGDRWDLAFLHLRRGYFELLLVDGTFRHGPAGKSAEALAELRHRAGELSEQAPDELRRGWARMYLGLIADNLFDQRDQAPAHYQAALRAGEAGDALLAREALRHLGDHDNDDGDLPLAFERWTRATELGAGAGAVTGTLSQQLLLAVLARNGGDETGATALAREIVRWAAALGAARLAAQAEGFLAGADPTAPPEDHA